MRFSTLYTMEYGHLLCLLRCLVPYRPPQSIAKLLIPVLPVVGQYISVKMTKILATLRLLTAQCGSLFTVLLILLAESVVYYARWHWGRVRSVSDQSKVYLPAAVMQILTFVLKTDFYRNNSTVIEGQIIYNIFSTTDDAVNARMKKPIVKNYAPGSVLSVEPLLDSVIGDFCSILEKRFMDGSEGPMAFDPGAYLAYGMSLYVFNHSTQAEGTWLAR